MQNRVGTAVPSAEDVATLEKDIKSIHERIARWGVTLSADERVSTAKIRLGGEVVVQLVYDLAVQHQLAVPGIPLEAMKQDLEVHKKAQRLEQRLTEAQQLAADTRLIAQSEAWQACMAYCSTLAVMASRNGELATALKPAVEFMSVKRGKPATTPA